MAKGERTRRMILERAAGVFNTQGYFGAAMSDLTRETGLEKGGIYNHFDSKEALALAAFDYSVERIGERFRAALGGKEGAVERLLAIIGVFRGLADLDDASPLPGGCPVLNTAIEADDAHPALRARAEAAMTDWLRLIGGTVKAGVRSGELRPDTDARALASLIAATLEGAVMLSRLYRDPVYMDRAVEHLTRHLESLARR